MPLRKRTSQSKGTPPTSPVASTSHATQDPHHHLRHTGPSIGARSSRVGVAPPKPPSAPVQPEHISESPPTPHAKRSLAEVSPPGTRTSFTKFMYVLLFLVLVAFSWYIYGMVTLLERLKDEVGWWGIVVGDRGGFASDQSGAAEVGKGGDLEGSLNALADVLGISPTEVASAVKPLVPRASLMSIASRAGDMGSSEAVKVLFEDTTRCNRQVCTGILEEGKEGDGAI